MEVSQSQARISRGLLVELDAILDTRLAVVRKLYGDDVAGDVYSHVGYRTRLTDQLGKIDPRINDQEFFFTYAKRDESILNLARRSLISEYLNQLILRIQAIILGNNPLICGVDVMVNTYPYKLTKEECLLIASGVQAVIGLENPPTMVYLEPKEITLDYIDANAIFTYVLYDFDAWVSAAFPDKKADSLEALGLKRNDNLTVIACNLVKDEEKYKESQALMKEHNLPFPISDVGNIPWALLFTLDLIDPIFFTEYNEEIAGKIMSVIGRSNSPINVEVALVAEYCKLLTKTKTVGEVITEVSKRLDVVTSEIQRNLNVIENFEPNTMRALVAEQRFILDIISVFIPSDPATDYERVFDSKMSHFDTSMEYSDISEHHWNGLGIPCKRVVHEIPELDRVAYILTVAEDVVDSNGVSRKKGEVLPSVNVFEPIIDDVSEEDVKDFIKELNKCKPHSYPY